MPSVPRESRQTKDPGNRARGFGFIFTARVIGILLAKRRWRRATLTAGDTCLSFSTFGDFIIPFLGIMSRHVKSSQRAMIFWTVWLLVMHYFDLYWLVMPELGPHFTRGLPGRNSDGQLPALKRKCPLAGGHFLTPKPGTSPLYCRPKGIEYSLYPKAHGD